MFGFVFSDRDLATPLSRDWWSIAPAGFVFSNDGLASNGFVLQKTNVRSYSIHPYHAIRRAYGSQPSDVGFVFSKFRRFDFDR
jgi:hypothetical protein